MPGSEAWCRSRRHLDGDLLDRVADGRVFTGRQALDLKLVDELGDEKSAIAWLAKKYGIDANTPVRDWQMRSRFSTSRSCIRLPRCWNSSVSASLARSIEQAGAVKAIEQLNLDGLLALWHPPATN